MIIFTPNAYFIVSKAHSLTSSSSETHPFLVEDALFYTHTHRRSIDAYGLWIVSWLSAAGCAFSPFRIQKLNPVSALLELAHSLRPHSHSVLTSVSGDWITNGQHKVQMLYGVNCVL